MDLLTLTNWKVHYPDSIRLLISLTYSVLEREKNRSELREDGNFRHIKVTSIFSGSHCCFSLTIDSTAIRFLPQHKSTLVAVQIQLIIIKKYEKFEVTSGRFSSAAEKLTDE